MLTRVLVALVVVSGCAANAESGDSAPLHLRSMSTQLMADQGADADAGTADEVAEAEVAVMPEAMPAVEPAPAPKAAALPPGPETCDQVADVYERNESKETAKLMAPFVGVSGSREIVSTYHHDADQDWFKFPVQGIPSGTALKFDWTFTGGWPLGYGVTCANAGTTTVVKCGTLDSEVHNPYGQRDADGREVVLGCASKAGVEITCTSADGAPLDMVVTLGHIRGYFWRCSATNADGTCEAGEMMTYRKKGSTCNPEVAISYAPAL